ncbi:MAG: hypothetical protein RR389_08530, partial [Christensenella sp.]
PKGDTTTPFRGVYDGGGFIIDAKNVPATSWQTVTDGSNTYAGLFGRIDSGTVKNMTLNNMTASVTESAGVVRAGAVAAQAEYGTFERITVNNVNLTATNTNGKLYMGGALGDTYSCNVDNCTVSGSITGATNTANEYSKIGGFLGGGSTCNMRNSTANVDVTDNSIKWVTAGGFAGELYGEYIVGNRCSGKINITQTAVGSISKFYVGGFIGKAEGSRNVRNNISSNVITFGALYGTGSNYMVGGFAGYNATPAANYSGNYYLGTVGANGYFADQVALRVTNMFPAIQVTDDAQIKRGAPINIANVVQTPNIWARGVQVSADITANTGITLDPAKIFVAASKSATT